MQKLILTFTLCVIIIGHRIAMGNDAGEKELLIGYTYTNVFILFYSILSIGISAWLQVKRKHDDCKDCLNDKKIHSLTSFIIAVAIVYLIIAIVYIGVIQNGSYDSSIINDVLCIIALCISVESSYLQDKLAKLFY